MECVRKTDKMHCCITSLQDAELTYPLLCMGFPASCAAGSFIQVAEKASHFMDQTFTWQAGKYPCSKS